MGSLSLRKFSYDKKQWRISALFFVVYFCIYGVTMIFIPANAALYPTAAVGIAALFFGGLELWPIVLLAALVAGVSFTVPQGHLITLAASDTAEAFAGAWLLRKATIDPLFRKFSDMFSTIATGALVSVIFPTLDAIGRLSAGAPYSTVFWGRHYAGALFSFLIIAPFLLRWCAKLKFSRPLAETVETIAIFVLLIGMNVVLFVFGTTDFFGVYLGYLLLFPLIWIALRLRPRFITLALLTTSVFAVWNIISVTNANMLGAQLFNIETLLIVLATIFLVIVSLEEDRRLNTNLMRSQLSTLENAVARIGAESQAKNDFIAVLAHELRNPLAPVVSAIDYLKISGKRDAEEMETLDMMEGSMKTVKRLLDDLLDVSRISEGKLSIKKERVELDIVLRRAILSTEHHVKERHQALTYKNANKKLFVEGDPVRLEQVFSNLITNASKYSDPGDPISVTLKKHGDTAQITVKDTGIGIPAESLRHIFTPFHQVGTGARTQKGLGIGLALVQSFVQVHGGAITVSSNGVGKGSEFMVELPLSIDSNIHIAKSK